MKKFYRPSEPLSLALSLSLIGLTFVLGIVGQEWSWAQDSLFPSSTPSPTSLSRNQKPLVSEREPPGVWTGGYWNPSYFKDKQVWGYVEKHSVDPGEFFSLMLSTGPGHLETTGHIEIFRINPQDGKDRTLVWRSQQITVSRQSVSNTAAAIGPNWSPTLSHIPTRHWGTGYYTIDFIDARNHHRDPDIAYMIVTNPKRSGDILLKLSTNTYQAYNSWGGHSFYVSSFVGEKGEMITFDRPTPPAFFEYEYYLVMWLESLAEEIGFTIDYATDFDIHEDPDYTTPYQLVISGAHDEYWSKEEFDQFYNRIFTLGKPTMFMGGNPAYFQIRYTDVNRPPNGKSWGRQLICYKKMRDPITRRVPADQADFFVTARFRDQSRRPETMLTGVGFQGAFIPAHDDSPTYKYYVTNNHFPFFEGTGYAIGDAIGHVVGYEWDNTDPAGDGARLWDKDKSRIPAIDPESISVLFSGNPIDGDGRKGTAEAVYFTSKAGGQVFSAGTIRWVWGLGKPGFAPNAFKRFNRNLILSFLGKKE
jgi:hypothetical protein